MAAKTTTRKSTAARKLPSYDAIVASKIDAGMSPDTAAQQAQVQVWAARHNVSYNHAKPMPTQSKAIDADHTDALRTNARQAKVDAMAAVEDFEIEGRRAERAFESLCTKYSEGNAMLILAQAAALGLRVRGVEDVAGFGCWTERGRSVVKGQHQSIFIWGHKVERKADEETPAAPAGESETQRKGRSFYPIVGLFHVSQTTAEAAK